MKLKILELNEDDKYLYLDFINKFQGSEHLMFYHSWEWGNFLNQVNQPVIRIAIFKDEKVVSVGQLVLQSFKFGTYWYCPRGLTVDYKNSKLVKEVYYTVVDYFRNKNSAAFIRFDPNIVDGSKEINALDIIGAKKSPYFIQAKRVWISKIFNDEELQYQWLKEHGMKKKLPNQIRKGIREGVTTRVSTNPEDIKLLTDLLTDLNSRKGGVGKRNNSYYETQFRCLAPSGIEKLFIAEKDKKVLAVNLFAIYNNEASYLHGASSTEHRELSAPAILHLKTMTYIKQNYPNVNDYNFWGVISSKNSKPGNPHVGYSDFKRGFGGNEILYEAPRDFIYNKPKWFMFWLIENYRKQKLKNF